jgi:hypothetical protein
MKWLRGYEIRRRLFRVTIIMVICAATIVPHLVTTADAAEFPAARDSITVADLHRHVGVLADDTFEGREAGSRGGRAAGTYLGRCYQSLQLAGGAGPGGYYQTFGAEHRNILAMVEGSDPLLKDEVLIFGAHYDHVGYGRPENSYGPFGHIHNGADDNASGTAALLEVAEAYCQLTPRPRRSVLFALWDAEEKGLLGSKYWVENPTLPLSRVRFVFNIDMIGRLRNQRVEVVGSRAARGFRKMLSEQNNDPTMQLDFSWELKSNSDHYTFVERNIPAVMLHTGLHDDYHRPSDDAEKLDIAGMRQISRLMFNGLVDLANRDQLPTFRKAGLGEFPLLQRWKERPLPAEPGRLGISWNVEATPEPGLRVIQVVRGSAAEKAGVRVGDKLLTFAGTPLNDTVSMQTLVLLATNPVAATVHRADATTPVPLTIELAGKPIRWGFSWHLDDAEPMAVYVSRVTPGGPFDRAGIKLLDRIHTVQGKSFANAAEFRELVQQATTTLELSVERGGRVQPITVQALTPPNASTP